MLDRIFCRFRFVPSSHSNSISNSHPNNNLNETINRHQYVRNSIDQVENYNNNKNNDNSHFRQRLSILNSCNINEMSTIPPLAPSPSPSPPLPASHLPSLFSHQEPPVVCNYLNEEIYLLKNSQTHLRNKRKIKSVCSYKETTRRRSSFKDFTASFFRSNTNDSNNNNNNNNNINIGNGTSFYDNDEIVRV